MNKKLEDYKKYISGKRIAVVGIGISNTPLIEFLVKNNAKVTACDKKDMNELGEICENLIGIGVELKLGANYLDDLDYEIIFKTPGLRPDASGLVKAAENGSIVTSEMEVFFNLCPAKIIAVTGSDGKTTTTTLIYTMLSEGGHTCHLGGNIGRPLIGDIEDIKADDMVVLELSSFQLFSLKSSPDIAVITNVEPNHLDWHTNMEEYIYSKKSIFKYQNSKSKLVLNYDNAITREMGAEAIGETVYFSRKSHIKDGVRLDDNIINIVKDGNTTPIMTTNDIKLSGVHNIENYMSAIAAILPLVSPKVIKNVAKTFEGVPHRIEFVCEVGSVKFYNDSIASSPTRTVAALNSFNQKIILIAGGYDKHIPFEALGYKINEKVKELILIGKTAKKIKKACIEAGDAPNITRCYRLDTAVKMAYKLSKENDIVILSPACASFDMFKNFEVRGLLFKEYVNQLK